MRFEKKALCLGVRSNISPVPLAHREYSVRGRQSKPELCLRRLVPSLRVVQSIFVALITHPIVLAGGKAVSGNGLEPSARLLADRDPSSCHEQPPRCMRRRLREHCVRFRWQALVIRGASPPTPPLPGGRFSEPPNPFAREKPY